MLLGLLLHRVASPGSPSVLALPLFHGQGDWGAGQRLAPAFALRDQQGHVISLAAQRGRPVLIAFLATAAVEHSSARAVSLAQALALVPRSKRPTLDIVSLDPAADTPQRVRLVASRWRLPRPYHWLSAPAAATSQTLRAYDGDPGALTQTRGQLDPPLYLVDRAGFERAGYLYPFFPTVLARDLERLYREP